MGSRNRAMGTNINHFDRLTKSDFLWTMKEHGFEFDVETHNKGERNQSRKFFATKDGVRQHVETIMKGEKVDWDDVWSGVCQITGINNPMA